jgi:hypothetical protein
MRKQHQQVWPAAIAAIEKGIPDVIGDNDRWDAAHEDGVIDDEQYHRFQRAVETLYDRTDGGDWPIYTRKKDSESRAQSGAEAGKSPPRVSAGRHETAR